MIEKMFKYIMATLIVVVFPFSSDAQNSREIEVSLSSDDFTLVRDDSITDINMKPELNSFFLGIRAPRIPYFTLRLLLPQDCIDVDAVLTRRDSLVYSQVELRTIIPYCKGQSIGEPQSDAVFTNSYPNSQIENVKLLDFNGFKIATVLYSPFRYDANNKQLTFYNSIKLSISYHRGTYSNSIRYNQSDREYVRNNTYNSDELPQLYPEINNDSMVNRGIDHVVDLSDNLYYLIVTSQPLAESFDSLVLLKNLHGIKAKIITTDSIFSQFQTGSNAQKIRNFLTIVKSSHPELTYVFLGGDSTIIPVAKIKLMDPIDNTQPIWVNVPSDDYYSCLNYNFERYLNYDTIYELPNLNDFTNLPPCFAISRLPFNSSSDVRNYIKKLWSYETGTISSNPSRDFLLAGSAVQGITPQGISDSHSYGVQTKNEMLSKDPNVVCNLLYDTGNDMGLTYSHLTSYMFNLVLSQGANVLFMDCHGNTDLWQLSNGYDYQSSDISQLGILSPFFIFTTACNTNDFSKQSFLGKSFLLNAPTTLVYLGNTDAGISYPGTNDQSYYHIHYIISQLFNNNNTNSLCLGNLLNNSKTNVIGLFTNDIRDHNRWTFFNENMLGDPHIFISKVKPQFAQSPTITATPNHLTINNCNSNNCYIVTKDTNDYHIYQPVLQNGSGLVLDYPENFSIGYTTVSSFLKVIEPIKDIDLYVDETLDHVNRVYQFRNIFVGKKENGTPASGTIQFKGNSNLTFKYTSEFVFDKDFICEEGTELIIQPEQ